jgi:DNA-binding CsgD family transcriptional regulator
MRLRMICLDKSLIGGTGELMEGECYRVGRSSRCSFVLDDVTVSRFHAEVKVNAQTVSIRDLQSRNGIFVDGVRVDAAEVASGQSVRFGRAQFRVVDADLPDEHSREISEISTHFDPSRPVFQPDSVKLLSAMQRKVLDGLLRGLQEKTVAAELRIKPNTLHNHVKEIYRKMGVTSRAELLALFIPPDAK